MGRELQLSPVLLSLCPSTATLGLSEHPGGGQSRSPSILPPPPWLQGDAVSLSAGPGISSYSSKPLAAGKSLEHCLSQAMRDVPKEKHADTPLYLGATAGMRLLR